MKIRPNTQEMLVDLRTDYPFVDLAQPFAGLTAMPQVSGSAEINQPELDVTTTKVGNLSALWPELRSWDGSAYGEGAMSGACADEDTATSSIKAIAEAAERYAMTLVRGNEVVLATADELGDAALDWRLFPRCLDHEYAAFSELVPFDPRRKMRWIKGVSLLDGRDVHVPVSLTHISTPSRHAEAFTLPISTGVAVHSNVLEATSRAILEVVERDAIALTWYLRRPLPRIEIDSDRARQYGARFRAFERSHVDQYLFDATTDIGIPVVYGLMVSPAHPTAATVVTAASDLDPEVAVAKAMREAVSTRLAVVAQVECPPTPEQCFKLEHGAAFMGTQAQRSAFDFLLKSPDRVALEAMPSFDTGSAAGNLRWLTDRLKARNLEAVAVELTTDELRSHGLRAVRVVIPALMPMSYVTLARFLAHPRLYEYAEACGLRGFDSSMVNPLPQPFA